MRKVTINLNSIDKVKSFCDICSNQGFDIDVRNDRYIVNAKSIMGLFSLDLSKQLTCTFPEEYADSFLREIRNYISE